MPLVRPCCVRLFLCAVVSAFGAGGLCATPAGAAEGQSSGGWVHLAPGTKAVFPGIHGGTAPVSLVPLADGRLQARSGGTSQDFIALLKGKDRTGAVEAPAAQLQPGIIAAAKEAVLADGKTVALVPSSPSAVWFGSASDEQRLSASRERQSQARKRTFAPLKLRPYPVLVNARQNGV